MALISIPLTLPPVPSLLSLTALTSLPPMTLTFFLLPPRRQAELFPLPFQTILPWTAKSFLLWWIPSWPLRPHSTSPLPLKFLHLHLTLLQPMQLLPLPLPMVQVMRLMGRWIVQMQVKLPAEMFMPAVGLNSPPDFCFSETLLLFGDRWLLLYIYIYVKQTRFCSPLTWSLWLEPYMSDRIAAGWQELRWKGVEN